MNATHAVNTIGVRDWLDLLHREVLAGFVAEGGSAVRFAIPLDADAGRFLRECLARIADLDLSHTDEPHAGGPRRIGTGAADTRGAGAFVFTSVDAATVRIHLVQQLFFAIAARIEWRDLAFRFVRRVLRDHHHECPEDRADFSLGRIAALNGREEPHLRKELKSWIERAVYRDRAMCQEFRNAMIRLCQAELDPAGLDTVGLDTAGVDRDAVLAWLRGEPVALSALKRSLIFERISRTNARYMLHSLVRWLRLCGRAGLVLHLDLSRYLVARRPADADGTHHYTQAAVFDVYEVMRQFIDATEDVEGLLVVATSAREFLSDDKRGLYAYQALHFRIADDEVRDRTRANPLSALVRLTTASGPADHDPSGEAMSA